MGDGSANKVQCRDVIVGDKGFMSDVLYHFSASCFFFEMRADPVSPMLPDAYHNRRVPSIDKGDRLKLRFFSN